MEGLFCFYCGMAFPDRCQNDCEPARGTSPPALHRIVPYGQGGRGIGVARILTGVLPGGLWVVDSQLQGTWRQADPTT